MRKRTYKTSEAARITGLSQKTIIRQCQLNQLRYWCVPGSTHRRIERTDLLRWMLANGVPLDGLGELSDEERGMVAAHTGVKGGAA